MVTKLRTIVSLIMGCGTALAANAAPLDLTGVGYLTYGNANVYSMPIAAQQYANLFGGPTGPGNPYYINSTPGAIKDQVVIYTGANGTDVQTNVAGFDDAYRTPSGSTPDYASIDGAVNVTAPAAKGGIANDSANAWNANLLAMKGFLDGGNPLFLFNNNETRQDQNLAIWAKLWLTDGGGGVYNNRYLYLSNGGAAYGVGGAPLGDATIYNPGNVAPSAGSLAATDYVLSGGDVCLDFGTNTTSPADDTIVPCSGSYDKLFSHNLGANEVAYVAQVPLLNNWLATLFALDDTTLSGYTLHLDLKLGCAEIWTDCTAIKIDNGYEQLWMASTTGNIVPEPGVLVLTALGLLAAGAATRRRVEISSQA